MCATPVVLNEMHYNGVEGAFEEILKCANNGFFENLY